MGPMIFKGDHMKFIRRLVIAIAITVTCGTTALAVTADPFIGEINRASNDEVSLYILPDGSGLSLTQTMIFGGQQRDATITVMVIDEAGFPIPNFPLQDIWLDSESTGDYLCAVQGSFWPDYHTDANGQTTFSTSFGAGGWSEGPVWVYLNGERAYHPQDGPFAPLPMRFNSADINGDGAVNLTDVILFTEDYYTSYHYRSDFHWDGALNLSDIGKMASGMGHNCQ